MNETLKTIDRLFNPNYPTDETEVLILLQRLGEYIPVEELESFWNQFQERKGSTEVVGSSGTIYETKSVETGSREFGQETVDILNY